jgi:type I restriction enzyme S subunit
VVAQQGVLADNLAADEDDITALPSDNLPPRWRTVRLEKVAHIKLGRTPARESREYWEEGVVPWVAIADLDGGAVERTKERISRLAHEQVFRGELVPPGTILLSFKLSIGKVGILAIPAVHNEAIASLTLASEDVDRDYLAYVLQTLDYSAYLDTYVKGRTLNKDKLKSLLITLPPLPEQRAIAGVLHFAQDAIQARRREVELERERKAALMQHLFTHGTRGEATKLTENGEMPESWRAANLGNLLSNLFDHRGKTPPFSSTGVQFISAMNVSDGRLTLDRNVRYVSPELYERWMPEKLLTGDVLLTSEAPLGEVALVRQCTDLCLGQRLFALRANPSELDATFLYHVLRWEGTQRRLRARASGTTAFGIRQSELVRVPIEVPPIAEQLAIAGALNGCEDKIAALISEADMLEELFRALLEELMTARLSALPLVEAEAEVPA